jgi:hypothetical protein
MNTEQEPSTNFAVGECEERAVALFEDAAALSPGPQKEAILKLAQG